MYIALNDAAIGRHSETAASAESDYGVVENFSSLFRQLNRVLIHVPDLITTVFVLCCGELACNCLFRIPAFLQIFIVRR